MGGEVKWNEGGEVRWKEGEEVRGNEKGKRWMGKGSVGRGVLTK